MACRYCGKENLPHKPGCPYDEAPIDRVIAAGQWQTGLEDARAGLEMQSSDPSYIRGYTIEHKELPSQ